MTRMCARSAMQQRFERSALYSGVAVLPTGGPLYKLHYRQCGKNGAGIMAPNKTLRLRTKTLRRGMLAIAGLAILPLMQAQADTIAAFSWVENSGSGGGTESGSLTLDLPGTVSNPFSVSFTQGSTSSAPDLTALSYTYSNGTTISLSNLTNFEFTDGSGNAITNASWATTTSGHGGFGVGTTDLITGFIFSNASGLKISEPLSLASNLGLASNQMTGVNDSGYWQLTSLTPVPLPAGFPLLLSGLAAFGALRRRGPRILAE